MWPKALVEVGVGGELTHPKPFEHYCHYKVIRNSVKRGDSRASADERCECGRYKCIDRYFDPAGQKSPKRTIRWYDSEGNLDRITGDT